MDSQTRIAVAIEINGRVIRDEIEPRMLLVEFIREHARLTGTHVGCDTSYCGACTLLLDGRAVKSCTLFAVQADGAKVTTVEGLECAEKLHPLQTAFAKNHALQCGFCTPGFLMSAMQSACRKIRIRTMLPSARAWAAIPAAAPATSTLSLR